MRNTVRNMMLVLFYLIGIVIAPILTHIVEYMQKLYMQGQAIISFPFAQMAVYVMIGVYLALLERIQIKNSKINILMCGIYLILAVCSNWATLQFVMDSNTWLNVIFQMDRLFHLWTILFGYFLIKFILSLLKKGEIK